ncbi:cell division protein FtsX [Emticicia aquatilis]|uniref:Cell division protein FtsX n=1 Tax=Emticicia aquatilis TaxID=1537369 RepID=A0A916YM79_9BACT|nr:permease-like cell division protein FtsX [Emticicia aquatilis]GGD51266.1 cell division protein FtsX [Emticicia aquatilis]
MQKKNRKLGSYPSMLIILSLTAALFLVAFSGWIALTSKQLVLYIKQNIEVQVYLDKSLTQIQKDSVRNLIAQKNYVAYSDNVPQIKFISKESTAEKVLKETNEDFRSILGENPYRDAFSLKLKEEYFKEEELAKIKADLESVPGIFEADYAKDFVDSINKNANKAYLIIASIVVLLLIAIVLLINNTIRLALYSQRFIIRSMQLVGATDWFIQKPFISRGILQGFISGVMASALLIIVEQIAIREIENLGILQNFTKLSILCGFVILLGILIGVLSTFQSMYRYLRTDLEDLY